MVPSAATVTTPLVTGMLCAVPGVRVTPLMLVMLKASFSGSVSPCSGLSVTGVLCGVV